MSTAPLSLRILLVATVAFNLVMAGFLYGNSGRRTVDQKSDRLASESRLQELINARKSEHWDTWSTEFPLTMPPLAQPVRSVAEWEPVGTVVLALDDDIGRSFIWNDRLETASKGSQILANDSAITDYIIAACNRLSSMGSSTSADPEVARFLTFCTESGVKRLVRELSFAHTFVNTLTALAQHVKVLVVLPANNNSEDILHRLTAYIYEFPVGPELLNNKNVGFAQLPATTKWIRDYGPIFVQGADGRMVLVDSRYNPQRESLEEQHQKDIINNLLVKQLNQNTSTQNTESDESAKSSSEDESGRRLDDISPSFLATHLRQMDGDRLGANPVSAVRPPLELEGGDFATDGEGIGFSSTQTLLENGGNQDVLRLVFRDYFGLTDIVYLEPLPGSTIKHIDMFFKVVSADTLLLGTFENIDSVEPAGRPLQAEAQRVLNYDLEILKSFYSNRGVKVNVVRQDGDELKTASPNEKIINIVLVPMPDVRRPVKEGVAKIDKQIEELTAEARKLGRSGRGRSALTKEDMATIKMEFENLSAEKKSLTEEFPQGYDIYRTYLNALQVNTSRENLLLIPSYENLDAMDKRVQEIFRRVYGHSYGNVSVIRVESDNLIRMAGSIHCLTQTIPIAISVFSDDWNYRATLSAR
jgi:agmatine/peptidylarginine deiminase